MSTGSGMGGRAAGRLGDKMNGSGDAHGCPACPHPILGPAIAGSPDVLIGDRPALRSGDKGMHAACCGPNTWQATSGSAVVLINDKPAHRRGDSIMGCGGGSGQLTEGADDVQIGDGYSGGTATAATTLLVQEAPAQFIEIELVDEQGAPVAGERFLIVTPEGHEIEGVTDRAGQARIACKKAGPCRIRFPDLDAAAWEPAAEAP